MLVIETDKLSKTYKGKRGARIAALKGLDLALEQGEVFGFLGPNGAGKSTTIKLLMGLITPTSGSARIAGCDIASPKARLNVGFLPENPAFYDYLTAEEYLGFVGSQFRMRKDLLRQRSEEALKLFDLWDARKRPMRGFSKGMVQRLGLAQVIVHDPDIYILDEPMSGLDPLGRAQVKDVILDLKRRGKTVFFSTHITSDVEQVCDRVGVILHGELKALECVDALMNKSIHGYQISFITREGNAEKEVVVLEMLSDSLNHMYQNNNKILLVEPLRKNLEQVFLDIVKAG